MKTYLKLTTLSLAASAILIGCGSSNTDTAQEDLLTGYFIDSAVEGLTYKTASGLNGVTDSQGRFQYRKGERVNFSLGKLAFGEAVPTDEGLVSPRELVQNQEQITLMLRTLQALDIDNDPSNGITIPASVISELENISEDISMSTLLEDNNILDLGNTIRETLDEDYDGEIDVDDTQAIAHFEGSMTSWNGGTRPESNQNHNQQGDGSAFDLSQFPLSTLTQEIKESLAYMGNEERLAYDIYTTLYNYHNVNSGIEIRQLLNIPKSEQRHVQIVQDLVKRYNIDAASLQNVVDPVADMNVVFEDMPIGSYDIAAIQDLYNALYDKGITSQQVALEVGCMVEVTDIDDLDKYIAQAEASNANDVVEAFNILRDGSYNHYWAFDKGLKNMGGG